MHTPLLCNDPCREAVHFHCTVYIFWGLHIPFTHWDLIYLINLIYLIMKNVINEMQTDNSTENLSLPPHLSNNLGVSQLMHYFYFPNISKQSATEQICPGLSRPTRRTIQISTKRPTLQQTSKTTQQNSLLII